MSKNSICVPPNLITYGKDKELMHFGMPRRSGRYPWGSGERPYQGDDIAQKKTKPKSGIPKNIGYSFKAALKYVFGKGSILKGVKDELALMNKIDIEKLDKYISSNDFLNNFLISDVYKDPNIKSVTTMLQAL